jgi:hypothetical protein
MTQMEASAASQLTQLAPVENIAPECFTLLTSYICGTIFLPCWNETGNVTAALPTPICRSLCERTNVACESIFIAGGQPPLNCLLYPLEGESTSYDAGAYTIDTCNLLEAETPGGPSPCPDPLKFNPALGLSGIAGCAAPCGLGGYRQEDEDSLIRIVVISSWVAVFPSLYMTGSHLLDTSKYKFPNNLIGIIFIFTSIKVISPIISYPHHPKCADDFHPITPQEYAPCGLQFFLLYVAFVGLPIAWAGLAFNMYMTVVVGASSSTRSLVRYGIYTCLIIFTAIPATILLALDEAEYSFQVVGCLFRTGSFDAVDGGFWPIVWVCVIVGNFSCVSVLFSIIKTHRSISELKSKAANDRAFYAEIRTLAFLLTFDFTILFTTAYYYDARAQVDAVEDALATYILCQVENGYNSPNCVYKSPLTYSFAALGNIISHGNGFFFAIIFGIFSRRSLAPYLNAVGYKVDWTTNSNSLQNSMHRMGTRNTLVRGHSSAKFHTTDMNEVIYFTNDKAVSLSEGTEAHTNTTTNN